MESLWPACVFSIIAFGTVHGITPSKMELYDASANSSSTLMIEGEKDPACYIEPKWSLCKYHFIKWHREYRWRAYYDPQDDECYYYRGCPASNVELFTFDIDCRHACVSEQKKLALQAHKLQHKSASLKFTKPHGDHEERREKKHPSSKPDLCLREMPKRMPKKTCKDAITKRAFFNKIKQRCYYFFDCGDSQKEYWSSIAACERDCGGRPGRRPGGDRRGRPKVPKQHHLRVEFSSNKKKSWKNSETQI